MKSKKATRRALLSSALSLVLCFSMLLGTTFAWFTDSASTAVNTIQSGTLEIKLMGDYDDDGKYTDDLEGKNFQFKNTKKETDILWEPGVTFMTDGFQIQNHGDLWLKYQLVINGVTDGNAKLLEAIDFYMTTTAPNGYTTGADYLTAVKAGMGVDTFDLNDFVAEHRVLAPAGKTDAKINETDTVDYDDFDGTYYLVGHMKEDADNQYQHLTIEGVGITVYATQMEAEFDSFDNNYDDGAYLPVVYDAAELASALENSESVMLGADIALTGEWTPIGDKDAGVYYTGTLDGAGHKITGLNVGANDYDALISAAKDATIKNLTVEGTVNGVNAAGIVARVEGETVIENCVSNVTVSGTTKAGGIVCNVTGADAKIINCTNNADISGGDAGIGGIVGYVNNDAYLEIINCTNNGDVTSDNNKYAGAAVGYAAGTSKGMVAGFTNAGEVTGTLLSDGRYLKDGDTVLCGYVATIGNWIAAKTINDADDLLALGGESLEGTYVLTADIDLNGAVMPTIGAAYGKSLTIIGNGHTISNATTAHTNHNGMKHHGFFYAYTDSTLTISDLTFDNIVIDATEDTVRNYGAAVVVAFADGGSTVNLTNVDVHNSKVLNDTPDIGDEAGVYVGYQTGTLNMVDCDSTGCEVVGETAEKTGAFIGMVNGTATLTNCTTDLTIGACNRIGGTLTIDGNEVISSQAGLNDAVAAGGDVVLAAGTYTLPGAAAGKTLTISGTKDTKIDVTSGLSYAVGADVTFEGVTIQSEGEGAGYTNGFADFKYAVFNNCVINGTLGLDFSCEFNNCTFNIEGNYYNVWTWGAGTATFKGCTFNCDGKALLVYANVLDNGTYHQTVKITDCTFNDNGDDTVTGKAAIEISNTYTPVRTYDVIINNTTVNGFAQTVPGAGDFNAAYGSVAGSNIGTNVWGNKCELPNTQINVVIDGVDVY